MTSQQSKIVTIAANAVTAKVVNAPREIKLAVQEVLTYRVDGFEHMDVIGWDGRSSFFSWNSGTFPAGFLRLVCRHLIKRGYQINLARRPFPQPLGPEKPKVDAFPEDPRYDYQDQVVELLLKHGQMVAQVATGGGKSRIAKLCSARIGRKTLFLTTRGILMYQMRDSFRDITKRVGVLGDGHWAPHLPTADGLAVNVGMVQTLAARLKDPDPKEDPAIAAQMLRTKQETAELLAQFDLVIAEEAHETSGNSFYDIMRLCRNAHYRLALTATPFMKDSQEANMRLMASSGHVGIKVSEQLLIERGILAKPYFKIIRDLPKPEKLYRSTPWQRAYKLGVVEAQQRNIAICKEAVRASHYGLPVLILVQHKKHGELLQAMLERVRKRVTFIFGEHEQKERAAALGRLKSGELEILIASTILDVGVDVPALGMVILAGAGKAEVNLRQRIGRGLREKKNGMPNVAFIVDFWDGENNHLKAHSAQRLEIIKSTPGFAENILLPGQDFDFTGFVRRAGVLR